MKYFHTPVGHLTLFQSRLSIIGLGKQGHQPFEKHPGKVLTYNGEIYNFKDLREELRQGHGVDFSTQTDTEVLYEALICWGWRRTLEKVNGIFAFSFYDADQQTIVLVRDHLGVKPIYYSFADNVMTWSSEAKTFFALGLVSPVLNKPLLGEYFANGWIYEPDTLFAGVFKLEAGHCVEINVADRTWTKTRYWDVANASHDANVDIATIVKDQTVADVPIGTYFSGGVDSSIVVCLLKDKNLTNFNLAMGDSESKRVSIMAKKYCLQMEYIHYEPSNLSVYDRLVYYMDEPIADAAILPAYLLAQKSRQAGRVVMLSGMGGDEIDAGYTRHKILARLGCFRMLRWVPAFLIETVARGRIKRDLLRLKRFVDAPVPENYFSLTSYFSREEIENLVGEGWFSSYQDKIAGLTKSVDATHVFHYLDFKGFLSSHNLIYMDKASMAASIEVRVPLLDKNLAAKFFKTIHLRSHANKSRLKAYLKTLLGDDYVDVKKAGFRYDIDKWLLHHIDWAEVCDFFEREKVLNTQPLRSYLAQAGKSIVEMSAKLWHFYTLYIWIRTFHVKCH